MNDECAGGNVKEADLDPFSAEIMRNYLLSTVKEMVRTTVRTAYSTCFSEGEDFTCGLFDRDGNMIAQAAGINVHAGGLTLPVRHFLEKFGDIRAGRRHHPQRSLYRRNAPGRWRNLSPDVL